MSVTDFYIQSIMMAKYSLAISIISVLVSIVSVTVIVLTLRKTYLTMRQTADNYAYDVWRSLYSKLSQDKKLLAFFGVNDGEEVDTGQLTFLLMVLDMYANRYRGDYSRIGLEKTLLHRIMESPMSRTLWHRFKNYFFSEPDFINEVDKLAFLCEISIEKVEEPQQVAS